MSQLTVFKVRIDKVTDTSIGFELFTGDHLNDSFVNAIASGGYGTEGRLTMTPKNFSDLSLRLIAYTYTTKKQLTDSQLKVLWGLKINIFDHESTKLSTSLFQDKAIRERLFKLKLIK
jgi:hypothetical protein